MRKSATGSFLKFTVGFVTFLVVSFGLTIVVSGYAKSQSVEEQAAAAEALMLK